MRLYRILLVEDERWVRVALRKTLEKVDMPFQVAAEVSQGMEAMEWLGANKADLVLTDIRMPLMDGIELLEQLQLHPGAPDVILISGYDDFSYAQSAVRLNAFDYLLKPVEACELTRCLQKWLDSRQKSAVINIKKCEDLSPVEQIISYIESSSDTSITLAEAAERVHLNASYFCKLFKQRTGMNYKEFVANVRLKEAERLLHSTSLRVCEIAERLGYRDQAYFSNLFKKRTGQSPSEFRKASQSVNILR